MRISEQIQKQMHSAMKSGDKDKVLTLRTLSAKLKDRKIDKGEALTEAEEIKVLQTAAKQRKESIELFKQGERQDLVKAESEELAIIEEYLPKQMSEEEVTILVKKSLQESGASGPADMGKVMSVIMKEVAGRADGKMIQKLVMENLQK
tara:strand:- start:8322 stop:8768 length:447 start_codon:yes stop_codon:yes gene_type:complete